MNRKEIVERQQAILDAAKGKAVNLRQRKQESLKACREA